MLCFGIGEVLVGCLCKVCVLLEFLIEYCIFEKECNLGFLEDLNVVWLLYVDVEYIMMFDVFFCE